MYDLIIRNGTIYDGSGKEPFEADIGVKNGVISKIGDLKNEVSDKSIDAESKIVTPGFVDIHTHLTHKLAGILK